jgi:ubiquitin-conjugating enzyme E2 Q
VIVQDPNYLLRGEGNLTIGIPSKAIPSFRHPLSPLKRDGPESTSNPKRFLNEILEDDTDFEDLLFLHDEQDSPTSANVGPEDNFDSEDLLFLQEQDLTTSAIDDFDDVQPFVHLAPQEDYLLSPNDTTFRPKTLNFDTLPILQPPVYATPLASRALMSELKRFRKSQATTQQHELGWYMDTDRIENIYQWIVELHSFDYSTTLAQDMRRMGITSIVTELRFSPDFPMTPPFVRIIRPRFLPFSDGGGGNVTIGGSMCMELLTTQGWAPTNSIDSVLLQIKFAMVSAEPPARLLRGANAERSVDYGVGEAVEAYIRACQRHGWEVPKGFREWNNVAAEMKR